MNFSVPSFVDIWNPTWILILHLWCTSTSSGKAKPRGGALLFLSDCFVFQSSPHWYRFSQRSLQDKQGQILENIPRWKQGKTTTVRGNILAQEIRSFRLGLSKETGVIVGKYWPSVVFVQKAKTFSIFNQWRVELPRLDLQMLNESLVYKIFLLLLSYLCLLWYSLRMISDAPFRWCEVFLHPEWRQAVFNSGLVGAPSL